MEKSLLALTLGLSVLFFTGSRGQANTPAEPIYQADYKVCAGPKCKSGTVYSWGKIEIESVTLRQLSVPITTDPTVTYGIATQSKGCFPQMSHPRTFQKYLNGDRFYLPREFTPKLQVKISLADEKTITRLRTQSGVVARITGTLAECSPIRQ